MSSFKIDTSTLLQVLISKSNCNQPVQIIDPGSAIVAIQEGYFYQVYYEGYRFGAENMLTIEGRIQIAASRLLCKYPTVAKLVISENTFKSLFVTVGEYVYLNNKLSVNPDSRDDFEQWVASYKPPHGSTPLN